MSEDIAKYELFLERNKPVIHHVSLYYARGNSDCFNDLMQEIAIVLWKEFKRYGWLRISDPVAEKAWTFRVANRAALRYMKKNEWKHDTEVLVEERVLQEYGFDMDEETLFRSEMLMQLIAQLKSRDREIAMLFLDSLPNAEIATRMGMSEPAVKTRISRMYQRLRKIYLKNEKERFRNKL